METAKLFWSGRSQAVRLPKSFRIVGDKVRIRRRGTAIVLEPLPADWSWLDSLAGRIDRDFAKAAEELLAEQNRPALDKLFS